MGGECRPSDRFFLKLEAQKFDFSEKVELLETCAYKLCVHLFVNLAPFVYAITVGRARARHRQGRVESVCAQQEQPEQQEQQQRFSVGVCPRLSVPARNARSEAFTRKLPPRRKHPQMRPVTRREHPPAEKASSDAARHTEGTSPAEKASSDAARHTEGTSPRGESILRCGPSRRGNIPRGESILRCGPSHGGNI